MGIIESVQQYDLNIPAGGAQNIDVAGDRVQFLSAVDPFAQIEIRPNYAQGNISLKPGQGFRFGQQVTRWVVFNRGAVALTGYLLIGSGDFFDQRISGDVNVIDGARSSTLSGLAFMGAGGCGAVAAQFAHWQIWNPAGSGKKTIISSVRATVSTAGPVGIVGTSTPLATALGTFFASKLIGGAASVATQRTENAAALVGGFTRTDFAFLQANNSTPIAVKEPIILLPGTGLIVRAETVNVQINATVEFVEEAA